MAKNLVIVESPAKAKTINKYLGRDYVVRASMGHVRDLPKSTLGVKLNGDVEVKYLVPKDKKEVVKELKELLKKAEVLWLATDLDREGEAIAWHLAEALKAKPEQTRRVTFNEITEAAIKEAFSHPRDIEMDLVDAQQSRRIIDRFVGYRLSPVLWDALESGRSLSAGRVQSVATRLVVDREREIDAFIAEEYFSIWARLEEAGASVDSPNFDARLIKAEGAELNFVSKPRLVLTPEAGDKKAKDTVSYTGAVTDPALADSYVADLENATYKVAQVKKTEQKRRPTAPFTTSTLQQEAARKLGFGARKTMGLAQRLYEGIEVSGQGQVGLITYMRTDSVSMSDEALAEIGKVVKSQFGENYYDGPRAYKTKAKDAQEAHEAVRPTGALRTPDRIEADLSNQREGRDLQRLYRLIWQRAVASQMTDARIQKVSADIEATPANGSVSEPYVLRATGQTILFDGFLRVYSEGTDADSSQESFERGNGNNKSGAGSGENANVLPELDEGGALDARRVQKRSHETKPPPRYTEATLVKKLEELGIGRPSTYAPTLSTITDREYVLLDSKRFMATELGMKVNDYLVEHFPEYVDYAFTRNMEDELDKIAHGEDDWKPEIRQFWDLLERRIDKVMGSCPQCGAALEFRTGFRGRRYVGCTNHPDCDFSRPLGATDGDWEPKPLDEICPECGEHNLVKKRGRFGWFIACSGYPECNYSRPSDEEAAEMAEPTGEVCSECGKDLVYKKGRFGRFMGCSGYPECKNIKNIDELTGVKCPNDDGGDLAVRRTKRRKVFYGCTKYPDCDFVVWEKPFPVPCPACKGVLTGAGATLTCSNPDCKQKFPREQFEGPMAETDAPGGAAAGAADTESAGPADPADKH